MVEKIYTVKELAILMQVHPATITRAIKRGEIKAFKPFAGDKGKWRISQAEVERVCQGVRRGA